MNKKTFVKLVQNKAQYKTVKEAELAIEAFTEAVTEASSTGEDVQLIGFGTFKTSIRKGTSGKAPGTGKPWSTQDKRVVSFKVGKTLAEKTALGN